MYMRLNLGCGDDIRDDWHNVDIVDGPGVDELHDLQDTPWPWKSNCCSEILMDNVLEHIGPMYRDDTIAECARVLAPGGQLEVVLPVPEAGCGWDLTHYAVPSWRWHLHPRWQDTWSELSVVPSRVGPGRLLPDSLALLATRFGVARCCDQVSTTVVLR
jgi:predicted SAM-dependent methyltransferase